MKRRCLIGCAGITLACGFIAERLAAQTIDVDPSMLVIAGLSCGGDAPPQTIKVSNVGSGTLTWQFNGAAPAWLSISATSGTAPSTLTVTPHTQGTAPGLYQFTLTISSNDPTTPSLVIQGTLAIWDCANLSQLPATQTTNPPQPPPKPPQPIPLPPGIPIGAMPHIGVYQVEFHFTGWTGEMGGPPDCNVNTQGFDHLAGILMGYEPNTPDDDVVYRGLLYRLTQIDYCETRGRRGVNDDEKIFCVLSLKGSGLMDVELTVKGDLGRGAWMKAESAPRGRRTPTVQGGCEPQTTNDVVQGYGTDDGGGGSPNGQQIDDTKAFSSIGPVHFVKNRIAQLRQGTYPPDANSGFGRTGNGWTLLVTHKIQ